MHLMAAARLTISCAARCRCARQLWLSFQIHQFQQRVVAVDPERGAETPETIQPPFDMIPSLQNRLMMFFSF